MEKPASVVSAPNLAEKGAKSGTSDKKEEQKTKTAEPKQARSEQNDYDLLQLEQAFKVQSKPAESDVAKISFVYNEKKEMKEASEEELISQLKKTDVLR